MDVFTPHLESHMDTTCSMFIAMIMFRSEDHMNLNKSAGSQLMAQTIDSTALNR